MRAKEAKAPHCLVNIDAALPVWDDNAGVVLCFAVVWWGQCLRWDLTKQ